MSTLHLNDNNNNNNNMRANFFTFKRKTWIYLTLTRKVYYHIQLGMK